MRKSPASTLCLFLACLAGLASPLPTQGKSPPPEDPCAPYYSALYRKLGLREPAIPVDIFKPAKGLADGRISLTKEPFYDPDAVYIGIANHDQAGTFHFYIVAGDHTFEASTLYSLSSLDSMKSKGGEFVIPKGTLFQLKAGKEFRDRVEQAMQELGKSRELTCLHGVCHVLREAGVELNLPGGRVRARPFLLNLLNGQLSENSRPVRPDQIRLLASSPEELHHFLQEALTADRKMVVALTVGAATSPLLLAVPVIVGGEVYTMFVRLQSALAKKESVREEPYFRHDEEPRDWMDNYPRKAPPGPPPATEGARSGEGAGKPAPRKPKKKKKRHAGEHSRS